MSQNAFQVRMLLKSRRRMEMRKDGSFPVFREPSLEVGWPVAIQASYARLLVDTMQGLNRAFFPEIRRQLPGWIEESKRAHRVDGEDRQDGFFMDLSTLKDKLTGMVKTWFGEKTSLTTAIFGIGNKTDRFNKGRVKGNIESVVRATYYPNEPWVTETIRQWADTNLDLVKSLTDEYIVKMNEMVQSAVVSGRTYQSVMDDLLRMGQGLTVARAKLIAVDQLGKLHGALTQARFQEAGLDLYEWRTSQDERVRGKPGGKYPNAKPSHWAIHGMVCTWRDGSVFRSPNEKGWRPRPGNVPVGIPGFPIRCFLGDRVVGSLVPAEVLYRHRFTGEGAVLKTNTGESLRCTANHPVLRADGLMVPAHRLNPGDKVFHLGLEGLSGVDKNRQDGMPTFEELFDLASDFGVVSKMAGSREDFHGDGSAEDVDVVLLESDLPVGALSLLDERLAEEFLTEANARLASFVSERDLPLKLQGERLSSNGLVRRFRELQALLGACTGHAVEHGVCAVSWLDSVLHEDLSDGSACKFQALGDLFFTCTGEVLTADVLLREIVASIPSWSLRRLLKPGTAEAINQVGALDSEGFADRAQAFATHGSLVEIVENVPCQLDAHVFNLQSNLGWYLVQMDDGSCTIVANCRCHAKPIWKELVSEVDAELRNER